MSQAPFIIGSGSNLTLQSGSIIPFAAPASFVVFSGSIVGITGPYYAINGSNNKVDYFGSDGTTVIQNTINAISSGSIFIKEGIYLTTFTLKNNVNIIGSGINSTIIKQPNSINGDVISGNTLSNIVIRDFSIDGNKANNPTGDNGISLVDISNINITRVSSFNNKLKGFAISDSGSNIVFDSIESYSNDQDGIGLASGTTGSGKICKNIFITNSYIHDNTIYGIGLVVPTNAYSQTENVSIINNRIINNASYGIEIFGAKAPIIIGNHIEKSGNHGIDLGSVGDDAFLVTNATIIGNIIKNGATQGIRVQSASGSRIIGNRCFDDQAVKTQTYGIGINAGSQNLIMGNDLNGNLTGPIDGSNGTFDVINNLGYNPQALATIAVGASVFTYTNNDGYPEEVQITGGTVSTVIFIRNAVSTDLGVTSGIFLLGPRDALQITYSSAPTMRKIPY